MRVLTAVLIIASLVACNDKATKFEPTACDLDFAKDGVLDLLDAQFALAYSLSDEIVNEILQRQGETCERR